MKLQYITKPITKIHLFNEKSPELSDLSRFNVQVEQLFPCGADNLIPVATQDTDRVPVWGDPFAQEVFGAGTTQSQAARGVLSMDFVVNHNGDHDNSD